MRKKQLNRQPKTGAGKLLVVQSLTTLNSMRLLVNRSPRHGLRGRMLSKYASQLHKKLLAHPRTSDMPLATSEGSPLLQIDSQ